MNLNPLEIPELLDCVFRLLDPWDLAAVSCVCRFWERIASSDSLWLPFIEESMTRVEPCHGVVIRKALRMKKRKSRKEIFFKLCWNNPLGITFVSVAFVNTRTGVSTFEIKNDYDEYCRHLIRSESQKSTIETNQMARRAHFRTLSGVSDDRKRKISELTGGKCRLDTRIKYG